jgi:hypothetical protein
MLFRISELAREKAKSQPSERLVALSIAHTTSGIPGESERVVQQPLEELRTDFDKFSVLEIEELVRHGWCVARDRLGDALPHEPAAAPPGRSRRVSSAASDARRLRKGALRSFRFLDARDWLSWAYGLLAIIAIIVFLFVSPKVADAALMQRDALRAERLSRGPLDWAKGHIPNPTFVDTLPQDANPGFRLLSEDRVWDLRMIRKVSKGASPSIPGTAYMMRSATAVWNGEGEPVYRFRFLTSGQRFRAWCVGDRHDIEILVPKEATTELSGDSVMHPYIVEVKLRDLAPGQKTVIQVQVESVDAFLDRNNWWTGMRVTTAVESISMRVVFPEDLPFRRGWTRFSMYPNETPAQSESFDGIVLPTGRNHELLWLVSGPRVGYTYRVDWDW